MVISTINQSRLLLRDAQTLLGICAGIVADGEINEPELAFLDTWLADHPALTEQWPGADIKAALAAVKRGESTRQALHENLVELVQIDFYETGSASQASPTLPLDVGCEIAIRGRTFCFTGRFGYGNRMTCETALLRAGGVPEERVQRPWTISSSVSSLTINGHLKATAEKSKRRLNTAAKKNAPESFLRRNGVTH